MDGISSDVSACVEGRVKESQRSKGDSFRFLEESTRRRASSARQKAVGGFFHASPKKKRHVCAVFWCPLEGVCIPVSKNRKRKRWKKSASRNARVVHAPRPSARSHPCPCPGGSAPRYPAPPRPPSRTLMLVTTAQPRRARLSRFRSFPASRGWKENGKRLVTDSAGRFLVRARGRGGAGWSGRRGRARGDGWTSSPRASRARSGRTRRSRPRVTSPGASPAVRIRRGKR